MGSRVFLLTLLLLIVILVFGWISIDSQFYALETSVEADGRLDVAQAKHKLAQPVVVKAEMLPEGRAVMLMPQYKDILVQDGESVMQMDGGIDFADGQYTRWEHMHPQHVWLFMVISEEKPKITVER
jgi:hypothetical protein